MTETTEPKQIEHVDIGPTGEDIYLSFKDAEGEEVIRLTFAPEDAVKVAREMLSTVENFFI